METFQGAIKNERDYAIRKGKVLERFGEQFYERFRFNPIYRQAYESLIRNGDPYEIIEKLIEINDEQFKKIEELILLIPPRVKTIIP
jgi:hypothetical protein